MKSFLESNMSAFLWLEEKIIGNSHFLIENDSVKTMTFAVIKIGRKWIKATSRFKEMDLNWDIEINAITKDWIIGETYTVQATIKVDRTQYGTKRYAYPIAEEDIKELETDDQLQNFRKEIKRWMGYIKDNIDNYWYKKGESQVRAYAEKLPVEEGSKYIQEMEELKKEFELEVEAPKEIERWLGYIKSNLNKYWYIKGVDKVKFFAKILKKEEEFNNILNDLHQEFKFLQEPKKVSPKEKKPFINISWGYHDYGIGDVIYKENEYVVITDIERKFLGEEDAMSFGGNEEGYLIYAYYRQANTKEVEDYKRKQKDSKDFKNKINTVERYFTNQKHRLPKDISERDFEEIYHFPDGGFNIYGSGIAYAISRKFLYQLSNNGMDGDDWSRNNLRTGGAGAIALEYAYDEEITNLIRQVGIEGRNQTR